VRALLAIALVLALPGIADADRRKKGRAKKPVPAAPAAEPEIEFEPPPAPAPEAPVAASEPPAAEAEAEAEVTRVAPAPVKRKRFYVRAGIIHVAPQSSSREMELADIDGAASLAVENGPIAGSGAEVGSATVPGLILGYVLPFLDDRLSLETVLGMPFTVKFRATGTLANESIAPTALGIPTGSCRSAGARRGQGGAAAAHPRVLADAARAGAAVRRRGRRGADRVRRQGHQPDVDRGQPARVRGRARAGLVFQGGLEAKLWKGIYARLDVKFIALMLARAEVHHIQVRTPELPLFDTVEVGTAKMSVWVNPLIVQAGLGLDF